MNAEEHVVTCMHCKSTEVADVERYARRIDAVAWQGTADVGRDVPRISFRCMACGKQNEYDVPLVL